MAGIMNIFNMYNIFQNNIKYQKHRLIHLCFVCGYFYLQMKLRFYVKQKNNICRIVQVGVSATFPLSGK